jgi:MFS superfamily sulfate permease-like transporter
MATATRRFPVMEGILPIDRTRIPMDIAAGVTLAALGIPEVMGYTSIAQTPIVTGVYTIIFPTLLFALLGSSRLLVVGADSATAAILAAGLAGLGVSGLTPGSQEWLAWCSLVALICGVFLILARLLRLGFIGNFLSATALVGFLSGVGVSVLSGQIPAMLGIPKGTGNWFQQQKWMLTHISDASTATVAFALGTVALIIGFKKLLPVVPGAVVAVVLSIIISAATDAKAHGVAVVGSLDGGFPPVGLPDAGFDWNDVVKASSIAFACFVLIVAQSAATSRSFAAKHGQRVDINRDLVGLSGASLAAGLTGTFVVNGSPTKTQILDGQKGRTQVANMTMAAVALLFVLFLTSLLTDMPSAVLAGIVFMIGVDLIDVTGLRLIRGQRQSEFLIACVTGVVVFAVGVEQGIILAILLSLLEVVRRAYEPHDFVIGQGADDGIEYEPATPGAQSRPGLVIFRFDAPIFYANASRFSDDVKAIVDGATPPGPVARARLLGVLRRGLLRRAGAQGPDQLRPPARRPVRAGSRRRRRAGHPAHLRRARRGPARAGLRGPGGRVRGVPGPAPGRPRPRDRRLRPKRTSEELVEQPVELQPPRVGGAAVGGEQGVGGHRSVRRVQRQVGRRPGREREVEVTVRHAEPADVDHPGDLEGLGVGQEVGQAGVAVADDQVAGLQPLGSGSSVDDVLVHVGGAAPLALGVEVVLVDVALVGAHARQRHGHRQPALERAGLRVRRVQPRQEAAERRGGVHRGVRRQVAQRDARDRAGGQGRGLAVVAPVQNSWSGQAGLRQPRQPVPLVGELGADVAPAGLGVGAAVGRAPYDGVGVARRHLLPSLHAVSVGGRTSR